MPSEITNGQILDILTKKIDEKFEELANKIDNNAQELNYKLIAANTQISELQKENCILKETVEVLDRKIRRNNIAIFGLEVEEDKILEDTLNYLTSTLQIQLTENEISNIYKPKQDSVETPIIVEFVAYRKKLEIHSNLHRLKNTGVSISNDMSKSDRKVNKLLRHKLKEARDKNLRATIRGRKLLVEGKEFDYRCLIEENFEFPATSSAQGDKTEPNTSGDKKVKKKALQFSGRSKRTVIKRN